MSGHLFHSKMTLKQEEPRLTYMGVTTYLNN